MRGDAASCRNLGAMQLLGNGVAQNHQQALTNFRAACDVGHARACYDAGRMLDIGQRHAAAEHMAIGARGGAAHARAVAAWQAGEFNARVSALAEARAGFSQRCDNRRFDELAHRFAAYALVFDTLMLIVGAVWAQDAWGRYWAWDPLESWAFASWLALALVLHARATLRPTPAQHGLWLAGTFALAFVTFFGVPFISTAPHKGAV